MSIQSDIEMIFIQAVEKYALKNKLSAREAKDVFHKHQVIEKMILQHEYLHQISFDEIMEYVDKLIGKDTNDLVLFHGTIYDFDNINLKKSHNRRDFGRGFYTTILEKQAKEWGYRLSLREKKDIYYVYQYIFQDSDMLRMKRFDALNEEWLEFVKENRSQGGLQHQYDIVIGPVADDDTMETIQLYTAGILSVKEAIDRLKYHIVNNQVSFHTKKALENLRYVGRNSYE